jgi:hypothetical protein
MKGQWYGDYSSVVDGKMLVNIDELDDHYEGVIYSYPDAKYLPPSIAYFSTEDKKLEHNVVAIINAIDT